MAGHAPLRIYRVPISLLISETFLHTQATAVIMICCLHKTHKFYGN